MATPPLLVNYETPMAVQLDLGTILWQVVVSRNFTHKRKGYSDEKLTAVIEKCPNTGLDNGAIKSKKTGSPPHFRALFKPALFIQFHAVS